MKKAYLIDASVYVFRAYFSIPGSMVDPAGNPVNAVYGFADFLARLLAQVKPSHVAVAFDGSLTSSFRNEIYPDYKARRELPPPELEAQITQCMALCRALGLATLVDERYEADDIIGSLATALRAAGLASVIVTSDKDLAQLIRDGDILWDFAKNRELDAAGVEAHFGVPPEMIVDFLALVGDPVDNIPGVAGIGPKSAAALLAHFGSLDRIYEGLEAVALLPVRGAKRLQEKLRAQEDSARLSQQLAQIACDMPLDGGAERLRWRGIQHPALNDLLTALGFGERIRGRLEKLQHIN